MPRLDSPRTRVPAGSVALAGTWCGVYPTASPGGWQLIGTTDAGCGTRTATSRRCCAPGTRVRFVAPMSGSDGLAGARRPAPLDHGAGPRPPGWAHLGVPRAGALDRAGRRPGQPAGRQRRRTPRVLEVTARRPRAPRPAAGAGSRSPARRARSRWTARPRESRRGGVAAGGRHAAARHARRPALRSYVAVAGGIAVEPVLGSRSTDTLAWVGPPPVAAGDVLPVGEPTGRAPAARHPAAAAARARCGCVPGPRADWFAGDAARPAVRHVVHRRRRTPTGSGCGSSATPLPLAPRPASCRARGWCSAPCRCRPTGRRWCSSPTTRRPAATRWSRVVDADDLWQCAQLRPGDAGAASRRRPAGARR